LRVEVVTCQMAQPALRHLTTARIAGAQKEHIRHWPPSLAHNTLNRSRLFRLA
jgi:hypothetical protein